MNVINIQINELSGELRLSCIDYCRLHLPDYYCSSLFLIGNSLFYFLDLFI